MNREWNDSQPRIAQLNDVFAYCDQTYDGMTNASATQTVKLFGGDTPKSGVLTVNNMHSLEHDATSSPICG